MRKTLFIALIAFGGGLTFVDSAAGQSC